MALSARSAFTDSRHLLWVGGGMQRSGTSSMDGVRVTRWHGTVDYPTMTAEGHVPTGYRNVLPKDHPEAELTIDVWVDAKGFPHRFRETVADRSRTCVFTPVATGRLFDPPHVDGGA